MLHVGLKRQLTVDIHALVFAAHCIISVQPPDSTWPCRKHLVSRKIHTHTAEFAHTHWQAPSKGPCAWLTPNMPGPSVMFYQRFRICFTTLTPLGDTLSWTKGHRLTW